MPAERIDKGWSLNRGTDELNKAIDIANKVEVDSAVAVNTANESKNQSQNALTKADNVQLQFNEVVIDGDSSVEAAQARVDAIGNVNPTLKARLDRESQKMGYIRYGKLTYPSEFSHPGVDIYRDVTGRIHHNFDLKQYLIGDLDIYFDSVNGNDTLGNGTLSNPFRTLNKAKDTAKVAAEPKIIIKGLSEIVELGQFNKGNNTREVMPEGKIISIIPFNDKNKFKFINGRNSNTLTWVSSDGIYKTTRNLVSNVMDFTYLDVNGVPIPFEKKTTLELCVETPFSYYTNGTELWVNRNGSVPDTNVWAILTTANYTWDISGSTLYLKDVEFYSGSDVYGNCDIKGNLASVFVGDNVTYWGGLIHSVNNNNGDNGLSIEGVGRVYNFNSKATYNGKDGFNYHYNTIDLVDRRKCTVFEFECEAYEQGRYKTLSNNNATTAHEGVTIFRVSCIGYDTYGPVCADVNGCNIYMVDCHMRECLAKDLGVGRHAAYYFDNVNAQSNGVAYLENCSGGGVSNYAIGTDNTFDIKILKFEGSGRILNSTWSKITQVEGIV
ncbi:hypothetical protein [Jeotgalibacillus proteolyticus]|uniref:Uncharacterized protein n=1 Tax=Jeotgalibacillus proteolyticus TaxID=2082395 RepID=A0A2S5GAT0_9BACL|nr:hypothetical protein [Jeotgalibacillus proteolyticus]PPA70031.1 hypothetical protein C4B60_10570 [Jeotgalibacillus proteolyticus]